MLTINIMQNIFSFWCKPELYSFIQPFFLSFSLQYIVLMIMNTIIIMTMARVPVFSICPIGSETPFVQQTH